MIAPADPLGPGVEVHTLDLGFQGLTQAIASYLVRGPDGVALVECGPGSTLPTLLARLAEHGLGAADIRHVLVTHIHLDHAGCAGWWAEQGARVYVHPRGAPHLVEPSRLLASAARVYGDQLGPLWGEVRPAPAERVVAVADGETIAVLGLRFTVIETPGHARHHHVYRIGDVAFTGDAAGVRLPGTRHLDLPAPPPEFDPETWFRSLDRLAGERLAAIYPTHFGRLEDVADHLARLRDLIAEAVGFVHGLVRMGADRETMLRHYRDWHMDRARSAGVPPEHLARYAQANPLAMSVDGITRYWRKRSEG